MSDYPIPETFSFRTERLRDTAGVVPTAELDLATAPALEASLRRAFTEAPGRVVLDLREVEFIDSSGLRTLLTARRQAQDAGQQFSLVAGHHGLKRTLEIAGVHNVFSWTAAEDLA